MSVGVVYYGLVFQYLRVIIGNYCLMLIPNSYEYQCQYWNSNIRTPIREQLLKKKQTSSSSGTRGVTKIFLEASTSIHIIKSSSIYAEFLTYIIHVYNNPYNRGYNLLMFPFTTPFPVSKISYKTDIGLFHQRSKYLQFFLLTVTTLS